MKGALSRFFERFLSYQWRNSLYRCLLYRPLSVIVVSEFISSHLLLLFFLFLCFCSPTLLLSCCFCFCCCCCWRRVGYCSSCRTIVVSTDCINLEKGSSPRDILISFSLNIVASCMSTLATGSFSICYNGHQRTHSINRFTKPNHK